MDSHDHGFHGLGKGEYLACSSHTTSERDTNFCILDGVLRTFAPNHTVIDAVKLSSAQIQQLVSTCVLLLPLIVVLTLAVL